MILLAPVRATGGITSWARQVVNQWPSNITVIDTSPWGRRPSQALNYFNAPLAFLAGALVWSRAIAKALMLGEAIWVTASPSIGFRVRDVLFLLLCNKLGLRTILHIHGSLIDGLFGRSYLSKTWATAGIRAANEVVVLDIRTQETIRELTTRTPRKIPNFLVGPSAHHHSAPGTGEILYVGRVSKEKGSDVLERIGRSLTGGRRLTVVGPIDPSIEESFRKSCVDTNVILLGEVAPKVVVDCMKVSDLLILPSHHEGFPMVVLEAMSLGLPVAAADVGACREMLEDGEEPAAGVILRNPRLDGGEAFIKGVDSLLSNPGRFRKMSGGITRVEQRYTAKSVIPLMLSIAEGV